MNQNLNQRQSQRMTLSPQMREYLRLLHLPVAELRQAVDDMLEENPMLEEVSSARENDGPETSPEVSETMESEEGSVPEVISGDWEDLEPLNFIKTPPDFGKKSAADAQKVRDFQENLLTRPESLFDFLEWQLNFLDLSPDEKKIAEQLIGNINQDGYLTAPLEDIAKTFSVPLPNAEEILRKVQQLDPPGVAARDLREALLLQLDRRGSGAGLAREIVREHLDLVAKHDWKMLAKIFCRGPDEIRDAVTMISRLEPKPGRSFYAEEAIAVTPDATITVKDGTDSSLEIKIHDEYIPQIRLNRDYRNLLRDRSTDAATKEFLRTRTTHGMEFIKALELRRSTLRGITEEIVRAQPLFFTRGFSYLRPLRLKDIAERLGLHESTVSRAIHGKYLATPQGTVPYKSFFSQKIETRDGTGESQKSILEKVKSLLEKEDPEKPLSDRAIVEALKGEGVQIARRTVTKYRKLLKAPSTHLRRRHTAS